DGSGQPAPRARCPRHADRPTRSTIGEGSVRHHRRVRRGHGRRRSSRRTAPCPAPTPPDPPAVAVGTPPQSLLLPGLRHPGGAAAALVTRATQRILLQARKPFESNAWPPWRIQNPKSRVRIPNPECYGVPSQIAIPHGLSPTGIFFTTRRPATSTTETSFEGPFAV